MIKSELIQRVADKSLHLHRSDIEKVVNAVLEGIRVGLARQDRMELRGFGSFTVKVRSARPGRNPKTGSVVSVPEAAHAAADHCSFNTLVATLRHTPSCHRHRNGTTYVPT
jgi:integration host factor subunit beta